MTTTITSRHASGRLARHLRSAFRVAETSTILIVGFVVLLVVGDMAASIVAPADSGASAPTAPGPDVERIVLKEDGGTVVAHGRG